MDKIIKYNEFDDDICKGDIVVFLSGENKKIDRIIGSHRIIFADGSKIDLFTTEVEGIIKCGEREKTEIKSYNTVDKPKTSDIGFLDLEKEDIPTEQEIKSESNDYVTYQELFNMMESNDTSGLGFSRYFWHYATLSNLVAIVNSGKFKSRFDVEGSIPYDNKIHNPTSFDVMFNNASTRTEKHARFYLRPLNKPYFSLYNHLPLEEQKLYCVCCIRKEALYSSPRSTFLYYRTAMAAPSEVYDKSNELNHHGKNKFFVNNLEKFNFSETYSLYDEKQSHERSLYQEAEFLVWKELDFSFVDKIYFKTKEGYEAFLSKIKNHKDYDKISKKCCIDSLYFGYFYD